MSEYAGHLANMQEKAKIVATEDILSDQGVLLAKSGVELNKKVCESLVKFKLLKPIEDVIAIENQLNAKSIYNIIGQLISKDPWIQIIHDKLGDKTLLQRCCLRIEKYPILLQKLTVLKLELFHVFEQAIFSAYLAYICAITDKLAQNTIEEYFLAGLIHDIGFLHINHAILKKEGELTPQEWRNIQSHPIIGYEIVKNIPKFPKIVSRAVLEHHESLDGSGYPRNKTGHDLCNLGQLINLLDTTIAIYNKKLKQQKRSIRGVIPVIQINSHSYSIDATSVLIRTLKHAPDSTPDAKRIKTLDKLITNTHNKQQYIQKTAVIIKDSNQELGYEHKNKELFAVQNIGNNIILIVNSAGLNQTQYTKETLGLIESGELDIINEVDDALCMLGEVIYQIQSYQKNADLFTSNNSGHPLTPTLNHHLDQVKAIPKPEEVKGSFTKSA